MSTSPDLTISIPDESLDLIRDSMSYSFGRDWLPWAWAVLAQAGDVPAEFDLDSFDYHEQLLVLAGLGNLYDLVQQVANGGDATIEPNYDLIGKEHPHLTEVEIGRYSERHGVVDPEHPESGEGLLGEAAKEQTARVKARLLQLRGASSLLTSLLAARQSLAESDDSAGTNPDAYDGYLDDVLNNQPTVDDARAFAWLNGDLDLG